MRPSASVGFVRSVWPLYPLCLTPNCDPNGRPASLRPDGHTFCASPTSCAPCSASSSVCAGGRPGRFVGSLRALRNVDDCDPDHGFVLGDRATGRIHATAGTSAVTFFSSITSTRAAGRRMMPRSGTTTGRTAKFTTISLKTKINITRVVECARHKMSKKTY